MLKSTPMEPAKKEILIASLFGFFLGIFFAFLASNVKNIKIKPNIIKPTSQTQDPTTASPSPTPQSEPISFTLISPDDETITNKDSVSVEGKADPQSIIIVSDEENDSIVIPNSDGSFSAKVSLTSEENNIIISTYKGGQQESVQRLVVYEKPEQ